MATSYIPSAPTGTAGLLQNAAGSAMAQLTPEQLASPFLRAQQARLDALKGGTLSSYTSPAATAAASSTTAPAYTGNTVVGQGEAWLSPQELAARNNALQSGHSTSGSGGGGGSGAALEQGGAGGGGSGSSSGGLGLGSMPDNNAGNANNGNPAFTNTSTPVSSTIGYQDPGSLTSTPTVTYAGQNGAGVQGQQGVLQMQNANPQSALDQFHNSLGNQVLNDPNAYQQSPGYQYAMDQAMGQVQNAASAKGMLESGAVLKNMQTTASGLAQQDYGNWWNRQNQLYGDYQNRLQGLAGGPTGSADAMTAGANGAQATLQTGSNLGSLFGNQGSTGMGGIINTGAAQSGNMINAGQQQAQVNSANQATQLAGATLASGQQSKGLF